MSERQPMLIDIASIVGELYPDGMAPSVRTIREGVSRLCWGPDIRARSMQKTFWKFLVLCSVILSMTRRSKRRESTYLGYSAMSVET
jgi:hypothetical protein